MDGILNFFKPEGLSSHDCVSIIRKLYNTRKVGHTGTLDPMATGVLPICIGKATKVSSFLIDVDKEYISKMTLGTETDTQDSLGKALYSSDKTVGISDIEEIVSGFIGSIKQIPPMYSAKKVNGKKLYELAREGITVDREPVDIYIKELELLDYKYNNVFFRVQCSKGTYVRTLCNDIGRALGTYGHMSYLQRTRVGIFDISTSVKLEDLQNISLKERISLLKPLDYALEHLDKIEAPLSMKEKLANGVKIELSGDFEEKNLYRIYCGQIFLGIGSVKNIDNVKTLKMDKVFTR